MAHDGVMALPGPYKLVIWEIQSCRIGGFDELGPSHLLLDRGNAEFGIVYRQEQSTLIAAQHANGQPVYFNATAAISACHRFRANCRKVTVLMPDGQVNLEFKNLNDAGSFVATLKTMATTMFTIHEVQSNISFVRDDFDMKQRGFVGSNRLNWALVIDHTARSLNQLWHTGQWSDFEVIAEGHRFHVHKSVICTRSTFFAKACQPGFVENQLGYITLEEDKSTVEALLTELYNVKGQFTGSLFTRFALKREMEKECTMDELAKLFIACDKYGLDDINVRVGQALVDRIDFVYDPVVLMELTNILHENLPENDSGMKAAMIDRIMARFPAIHKDPIARLELHENTVVLNAVHSRFSDMIIEGALDVQSQVSVFTPPSSPDKAKVR